MHHEPADALRRRWRWGKRLLVGGASFVAIMAVAWVIVGLIVERQLAAEIERIRAAGEPLTWHSLHGDLQTTGAGLEYEAAFDLMSEIGDDLATAAEAVAHEHEALVQALAEARHDREPEPMTFDELGNSRPPPAPELYVDDHNERPLLEVLPPAKRVGELLNRFGTQSETAADMTSARELVRAYALAIVALDRAAQIEPMTFNYGADQGMFADMPALGHARSAANLLLIRALVAARDGDIHLAYDSAVSIHELARVADDQPMVLAYLVGTAIRSLAVRVVTETSAWGAPDEQQLSQIQQILDASFDPEAFREAIIGERVLGYGVLIESGESLDGIAERLARLPWPLPQHWTRQYLNDMAAAIAIASKPPVDRTLEDIEPSGLLSGILFPPISRIGVTESHLQVDVGAARAGLAIAAYRRDHGELPASLQALVPEYLSAVSADPFNGEPLRFVIEQDRYIIYSVGENLIDDGGDVGGAPDKWNEPTDYGRIFRRK